MPVSRGHHFVPQGYLRNFGDVRSNGQLTVFDRSGNRFSTGTGNIAKQRDFNTVRDAEPSDIVETYYSEMEDKIADALARVHETAEIEKNNLDYIIALIAILHVRSPQKRLLSGNFMSSVARRVIQLSLRDKETYDSTMRKMRETGHDLPDTVSYEYMKSFFLADQYTIETETEAHIEIELKLLPEIEILLRRRQWCLMVAPEGSQFITSDHPSNLFNTEARKYPRRMGLAQSGTEVFLPISPRYAVAGSFEDQPVKTYVDFLTVAERNSGTIKHCTRQVYAFSDDFLYKRPRDSIAEAKQGINLPQDPDFLLKP